MACVLLVVMGVCVRSGHPGDIFCRRHGVDPPPDAVTRAERRTATPLRFLAAIASHHATSRHPSSAEGLRKQLPIQGAQLLPQPPVFHIGDVRRHPSCIYLPCLPFGLCAGMRRYGRLGPHAALQSLSVSRSHCSGYPPCPAKCLARCPMAKRRSSCPSGSFW